ncbi:MAG TPA: hypothetical protein VLU95_00365 [Candidatus Acidoferrum sp.]|nr:hypothetical protein [Candidatus Acidoferrum sp.]
MNSLTLKEMGFSQPCSLRTVSISSIPDNSNVLALIDTSLTGKAESDILYIGRSKKPAKKILGGYIAGYGGKNTKKINAILLSDGYIEKTAVSWMACEKPKAMQRELLDTYVKEHGKVPMWNASKKKLEKVQKVGTEKKKSTAIVSGKVAKAEKPAPPKKAKAVKPASPKSTVPLKVAIPTKPTEPSTSASSNHTGAESA